jgi:signal recognition particle receptor subunit alpha
MLDTFEIINTNGVVLWSRSYAPIGSSIVNNFISDTFIEEKSGSSALRDSQSAATNPPYRSDQHTLKWTVVKELGVIFVVGSPIPTHTNMKLRSLFSSLAGCLQIIVASVVGR